MTCCLAIACSCSRSRAYERVCGLSHVGVHRLTYYAWKRQVDCHGLEMLRPRERRRPQMPNQLAKMIEERIVSFSIAHPGLGAKRVASELAREKWGAIIVSPNGVWKVLCRHGLNTRAKRLGLIAGYGPMDHPGFVESGCCCRRSCAQPKVVHSFFARARACAGAREAIGVAGGVVGLVLDRGAHPQRAVKPGWVVEAFDVLEDGRAQLGAGRPSSLWGVVQQLLLGQRREERLGDGVVVGVAAGAHRDRDPGLPRGASEREADVLPGLNRSSQQCRSDRTYRLKTMESWGLSPQRLDGGDAAVVAEARPEGGPERR